MKKVLWEDEGNVERGVMDIIYITFVNLMAEDSFIRGAYDFRNILFPIESQILSYFTLITYTYVRQFITDK